MEFIINFNDCGDDVFDSIVGKVLEYDGIIKGSDKNGIKIEIYDEQYIRDFLIYCQKYGYRIYVN